MPIDKATAQADWEAAVAARAVQDARLRALAAQADQVRADAEAQLATINAEAAAINVALPALVEAEQAAYERLRCAQEEAATGLQGGVS